MGESLEVEVAALARQIAAHGAGSGNRVFRSSWWSDRLLQQAMGDAAFRTQLFRFVDVFPATTGSADVLRHLQEYFDDASTPKPLRLALGLAEALPTLGAPVAARVAGRNIRRMAGQFIVGADVHEAVAALASLWASGSAATVDFLGEKTVVDDEADRYAVRVELTLRALLAAAPTWPSRPVLEGDDLGALARVNVSVKPSALTAEYGPLTAQAGLAAAKDRIRPLLRLARDGDAFVNFDMEHYEVKDLTLQLFRELLTEEEFAGLAAGIVVQAYLRDSAADLAELIAWSGRRAAPVTVRLVKGAYWDT
nr:proline dehydrogenase family protein [Acidimicrobiia bacterium]